MKTYKVNVKGDYINGEFFIHPNDFNIVEDLIDKKNMYGELGAPEHFDVSLSRVSHIVEKIELKKSTNTLFVKCRVLNTKSGKELKTFINIGIDGLILCSRDVILDKKIFKIITFDVDFEPKTRIEQLRKERKTKLDKINERTQI